MSAKKGNQNWRLRAKHGRDKLFATPELLWEAACEYFDWCDKHPLFKICKGKDETPVKIPKLRPFTLKGLCTYLHCNTAYFRTFKSRLDENDEGFDTIITRIEQVIYVQKFEGAVVGIFNVNIIARELGLTNKQSIKNTIEVEVEK